ncbi:MAG TPA: hypothetical protein VFJ85_11535 [Acidimicrobiales bacterium]|nr:hypothetical protein [Acidimicrobiales bacterium]
MAVETPEREEADEQAQGVPASARTPSALARDLPAWAPPALVAVLALLWLVLRPASPSGVAAVVDLLVFPVLLVVEVRLLAGRPSAGAGGLATSFGFGAVGATVAVLVVERLLRVAGIGAVEALGPILELAAVCAPAVVLALTAEGPVRPSDSALAGFATGLGFLVVEASLATAARHVAPDYLTPLVAGLYRVPASGGQPAVVFAGLPLAAAFVGLVAGFATRWGRAAAAAATAGAFALVAFGDGLFQWRLRHFAASKPAVASGPVALLQALTLRGWLVPLLLVGGLVALRVQRRRSPPAEPPADTPAEPASDAAGGWALAAAVAVPVAVVVVLLARNASLGFLADRPVALLVSLAGLLYSGLSLATVSGPESEDDGSKPLCVAAFLCAGVGVLWSLLPTTIVRYPVHGGLLVDTALGWGMAVGNLGVVLGLGGFAAPPGRVQRGGRVVFGFERRKRARGGSGGLGSGLRTGGVGRAGSSPSGTTQWWRFERRGRRGRRGRDADGGVRERSATHTRLVTVSIEPAKARPVARLEFTGPTVKDAMAAALAAVGDLAHSSLQLVDEGSSPGKGPGRPARVRVVETAGEEEPLLPPARDSVLRHSHLAVVVEIVADEDVERPDGVDVELRAGGRATTIRCTFDESVAGRDRYRSNAYSVWRGEDVESGEVAAPRASPLRVANGDTIEAEYRREKAVATVYDTWADQVAGVNRGLFETTKDNYKRVLGELEELAGLERTGHADQRLHHRIEQLRTRLSYVDEGLRMLDRDGDADAKAFRSTAALAMAMSLDERFDDRRNADALLDSASVALAHHRAAVAADPEADVAAGAYRVFLGNTVVGRLWHDGAWSPEDVSRAMGWFHLADVHP